MFQSRTHNCGELRLADAGKTVTLCGWMENVRQVSGNLAFVVLRDFYGTTQIVVESEEMMVRPKMAVQKNSGGPKRSDHVARGRAKAMRMIVPMMPPMPDANDAVYRASSPRPFLAIG